MEITAKLVSQLREMTGAGMMECKKALTEANGDIDEAQKVLRKKGLAAASKKAGRIASEGRIALVTSADARSGVVIEVNSETDFVARNEDFKAFCTTLATQVLTEQAFAGSSPDDAAPLLAAKSTVDPSLTVEQATSNLVAKIGESIKPRRYARLDGTATEIVGSYVHGDGKIGVLVLLDVAGAKEPGAAAELAKDLAMHVAAAEPRFVRRDEVDAATIASEKDIAMDQARKAGKPEAILEKIATGRVEKFFGEVCLLEQPFVKNPELSVEKQVAAVAAATGSAITVRRFVRFKLGEGLQKRSEDFAAEVAAATGVTKG
jgi:elongation factor Ts